MTEFALPLDRYTAKTHIQSLEGLVSRYEHEEEPIHYKKAAVNVSESTCSSCLRYFSDIGLITAEKQGVYIPPDSVIDLFTKVGEAKENAVRNITSTLADDPIYNEVIFHLDDGGIEIEELATNVASGLSIKKDDIKKIERAIDIFAELGTLKVDEEGIVTKIEGQKSKKDGISDTNERSQTDDGVNQRNQSIGDLNKIDPSELELELTSTRGDPESLRELCTHLREGGTWSLSEISEETGFAKRTARGHTRYGEELGFVKREEGGISLTERGYELGFEPELNEETQELFFDGVLENDFYALLLSRCIENVLDETDEEVVVNTTQVEKELRTYFGFTEETEQTLRDVISTFFKTIDASGFGEYVVGRGGRETRLEIESVAVNRLHQILHTVSEGNKSEGDSSEEDKGDAGGEETQEPDNYAAEGPPLRISSFRIQNFRNLQDTGVVRLENITTFIGKNESGKTSTLEAIASVDNDYPYHPKDICNDIDYEFMGENTDEIPILTLTFEITEAVLERFYPDTEFSEGLPITYEMTKYADGSIEKDSDLDISPPSPDIVYYNDYDIISDSLYFDEDEEEQNATFKNLLKIGDLTERDVTQTSGLEHHQAIEEAENRIETRLNDAWSQKDIRINLRYNESENTLNLFVQDDLEEQERTLTQLSQRSEGFQWFFSFYVNLLAETSTDEDGYKILLLDDPAVHLHPSGKQDWLDSLEEVAKEDQVIYTSHSPYLIEKQYPSRIRTVQDSPDGTQISADIFDADTGTFEPLRNALGIDLSSSPFISEGQVLVEGPSEYYILTAVGAYFENELERQFIDWNKVSIMPVRGANDAIGKASWLASENIEYAVLLDSDDEGQDVQQRISEHHQDIDDERVVLLERRPHDEGVVLEDIFAPEFYVSAFNDVYKNFTADLDEDFEPLSVESKGHNSWEIGVTEYNGSRIDKALIDELERQDIADELRNEDGEIEILKRSIAEEISDRINQGNVEEDDLDFFNPVLAKIDDRLNI